MSILTNIKTFANNTIAEGEKIKEEQERLEKARVVYRQSLSNQSSKELVKTISKNCLPETKRGLLFSGLMISGIVLYHYTIAPVSIVTAIGAGLVSITTTNQALNNEGEIQELIKRPVRIVKNSKTKLVDTTADLIKREEIKD